MNYTYDTLDRMTSAVYNNGTSYVYKYTGEGQLYSVTDSATGRTYIYDYDSLGRLIDCSERNGSSLVQSGLFKYDKSNRISRYDYGVTGFADRYYEYSYNPDNGNIVSLRMPDGNTVRYSYDMLQRLTKKDNGLFSSNYSYLRGAVVNGTTTVVSDVVNKNASGGTIFSSNYTCDDVGNIEMVVSSDSSGSSYTYDKQNQLTQEYTIGGGMSSTYNYTYDTYGNIRSKAVTSGGSTTTKTFTYGNSTWHDLLTAYNGSSITYDNAGNPTGYYDGSSITWSQGRRLASINRGGQLISYTYNADGLRLSKNVRGTIHNYTWQDGRLLTDSTGITKLEFMYDESGSPFGLIQNGTPYYYIKNLQGDVIQIIDGSGTVQGSYRYNAWGEVISSSGTIAIVNPIRYRGYYQDYETGFYYLQSRYYDPVICRFINADSYASTGQGFIGMNMFAYYNNNPVNLETMAGDLQSP